MDLSSARRAIAAEIAEAAHQKSPIAIRGEGTQLLSGMSVDAPVIDTSRLIGVIDYEPSELVITVGSRTPVRDVVTTLAEKRQMLAFEPMQSEGRSTIGGMVAAQRGGPRRWTAGSVRDHLLGLRLIDGMGRDLKFGGQVIKNVAGFDVTRLQAGAWGTLGLITEVSLKVLPLPPVEETLQFELDEAEAIQHLNDWAGSPHPFSGSCWAQGVLRIRLSGVAPALKASMNKLGGQVLHREDADEFWRALRERQHPFFEEAGTLWRIALPPTTPPLGIPGATLIEWGGGQRWLRTVLPAEIVRSTVQKLGGHAMLIEGGEPHVPRFHPLSPALKKINERLKAEFDPHHILNPGLVDFF